MYHQSAVRFRHQHLALIGAGVFQGQGNRDRNIAFLRDDDFRRLERKHLAVLPNGDFDRIMFVWDATQRSDKHWRRHVVYDAHSQRRGVQAHLV